MYEEFESSMWNQSLQDSGYNRASGRFCRKCVSDYKLFVKITHSIGKKGL
jgi:hypothetical protein